MMTRLSPLLSGDDGDSMASERLPRRRKMSHVARPRIRPGDVAVGEKKKASAASVPLPDPGESAIR
jgi:hypothetical protein